MGHLFIVCRVFFCPLLVVCLVSFPLVLSDTSEVSVGFSILLQCFSHSSPLHSSHRSLGVLEVSPTCRHSASQPMALSFFEAVFMAPEEAKGRKPRTLAISGW